MAINNYNIGPDYSSIYNSSRNVKPSADKSATGGGAGDTIGETKNKANEQLGMVAGVANTMNNVANAYEEWNRGPRTGNNVGETVSEGVSTGSNVSDKVESPKIISADRVDTQQPSQQIPKVEDKINNTQIKQFQNNISNIQKQNETNIKADMEQPTDFEDVASGKVSIIDAKRINSTDKAKVERKSVKTSWDDEIYQKHDLGDVGLNWWTARNVALPVLNYAAQFNAMDSTNKWLQAGMTTQRIMQNFAGKDPQTGLYRPTVLDNYYISNFVELADLATNWKDRNAWQNAMAGAQSAVDMIKNFGWSDTIGGDRTLAQMADGLAYLNFGSSIYQMGKNWSNMNAEERTAAFVQTLYAGVQAYNGGSLLIDSFAPAADVATPTAATTGQQMVANWSGTGANAGTAVTPPMSIEGSSVPFEGATGTLPENMGAAGVEGSTAGEVGGNAAGSTVSTIGGSFMAVVGAYSMAKGIEGLHKVIGTSSAANRKAGAMAGMSAGAGAASLGIGAAVLMGTSIGSSIPIIGTIIGAAVGAVVGVVSGSINTGNSKEKHARDNWRATYGQIGVFSRAPKTEGSSHHTYAMQLADGRWYDVGHDGSGSRATFINGEVKQIANPDRLSEDDRHRMVNDKTGSVRAVLPYNVDYTNDLDVVGNMMLAGMIVPIGGTYQKERSAEVPQMLGYMTNGITSNCGRDFSIKNYQIMADNAKALYAKIGITNKTQMVNSMGEAYLYGQISYQDYMSSLTAANLMYDENGYQQAQAMIAGAQQEPQAPSNN